MLIRVLTVGAIAVAVNFEYSHGALVAHALLGDADDLVVILVERDPLHCGRELPEEEALPGLDGPQTHRVVGRTADEEAR